MNLHQTPKPDDHLDQLRTFRDAADRLGIPYFKVQRAAKRGLIPTYSILNARRYVTLRDILSRMSSAT
jgi:hypothetical protein